MNRTELLRLIPRNGADSEGAQRISDLGWPTIGPVLRDIVRWLRVDDSPVADAFGRLLARIGSPAAYAVAWHGLLPENCWMRHRLLCHVLPQWPIEALRQVTYMLTMVATQPDAYHNDLVAVRLLADHGLTDAEWLRGWMEVKAGGLQARSAQVDRAWEAVEAALDRTGVPRQATTTNRSMPPGPIVPELPYDDVVAAARWLRALGFDERIWIGTHRVQLCRGAATVVAVENVAGGRPAAARVLLPVADVDAVYAAALAGGARSVQAPTDHPYGERQAAIEDCGGHRWTLSQTFADVHPASWGGRT